MKRHSFDDLVRLITGDQPPRVWSLLVTVFGDMALAEGAQVSGAVLGQVTDLIGIKPEATRVALHRLRKDGWIDSLRTGRKSNHYLTPWGRAQSAAASPVIYAASPPEGEVWLLVSDPSAPTVDEDAPDCVWVTPGVGIAGRAPKAADLLATPIGADENLPRWMTKAVCDGETVAQSRQLAQRLSALEAALRRAPPPDPLQTAALRVLVVHSWRRIVLRVPQLPERVFPDRWQGAACRRLVAELLEALPPQTLPELELAAVA